MPQRIEFCVGQHKKSFHISIALYFFFIELTIKLINIPLNTKKKKI